MTEDEIYIQESIFNQVRMGFISISEVKENIIEEVEDNGFENEISENWILKAVDSEYKKLISERSKWKKPTDTEKLIQAFDQLWKTNIIALHNAGYTTSDGEYEVIEIDNQLRENQLFSNGYCFYHEQDLARAIDPDEPSLYIAFQKVDNSDNEVTLEIGRRVVKVLIDNGFEVDWNEDANSKILIPNFKWQHIYDEDKRYLQDYDENIESMSQEAKQPKNQKNNTGNLWSKLKNLWS